MKFYSPLTFAIMGLVSTLVNGQLASVITHCTTPNTVALTFDDGPWYYIYDASNYLTAAGAKGTFFFSGNNWGCIYNADQMDQVKYAYNNGHQVASHTWHHHNLATLSWDQVHDEMWRVEQALQRIVGVSPAFMRPPYGSYNDNVRAASYVRNQTIVNWDFDSGDTWGISASEVKGRYNDIVNQHPNTILTLNHETSSSTVYDVLPYAISRLQGAGYNLVTVAECLGMPAYQWVASPGVPDSSWHC